MSNLNAPVSEDKGFLQKKFNLKENKTNAKTEIIAGITTFLTMAYIIAVNPNFLSTTGMDKGALVTATCLAAGLTTILMGLYANMPYALASGMGLNAFFAFTVCGKMGIPWQVALMAVFAEGVIFIILTLTNAREAVVNAIPKSLKISVSAGIGLFIALIGFEGANIIVGDEATLVTLGNLLDPRAIICILGVFVIAVLKHKNVKGAVLWGILSCTIVAWVYALIIGPGEAAELYGIYLPNGVVKVEGISSIAFKLDFSYLSDPKNILTFISVLVTFLFVDFFDTVGTIVGVASKSNMFTEDGKVINAKQVLMADAIGTTFGSLLGVSTVTTYVESSAGVAEGGRTGLTAVTTGILFLLAIFFSPIFMAIPSCATSPALIIVGLLMMQNITQIDFYDFTEAVPAFLTIILMPLAYSIADGLMFGVIFFVLLNLFAGKRKKVSNAMIVLALLFLLKIIFF